jgi:hypothetical protein
MKNNQLFIQVVIGLGIFLFIMPVYGYAARITIGHGKASGFYNVIGNSGGGPVRLRGGQEPNSVYGVGSGLGNAYGLGLGSRTFLTGARPPIGSGTVESSRSGGQGFDQGAGEYRPLSSSQFKAEVNGYLKEMSRGRWVDK